MQTERSKPIPIPKKKDIADNKIEGNELIVGSPQKPPAPIHNYEFIKKQIKEDIANRRLQITTKN